MSTTKTSSSITDPASTSDVQGNTSTQSSISLYLYVFLAVLVIVVCFTSTSFVHRRRQRHLLESIRSGPWPRDGSFGFDRQGGDLESWKFDTTSKEPRIWEVCIRKEQQVAGSNGPSRIGATGDWNSMTPLCVIKSTIFDLSPHNSVPELAPDLVAPTTAVDALSPTDSLGAFSPWRVRRALRITAPSPLRETNPPTSCGGNIGNTDPKTISDSHALEPAVSKLQKITAAILINMPSRDRSSRRPSQLRQPESSSQSMPSPQPPNGSSPHSIPGPSIVSAISVMHSQYTKPLPETKAEGLPLVEFGILELLMRDDGKSKRSSAE